MGLLPLIPIICSLVTPRRACGVYMDLFATEDKSATVKQSVAVAIIYAIAKQLYQRSLRADAHCWIVASSCLVDICNACDKACNMSTRGLCKWRPVGDDTFITQLKTQLVAFQGAVPNYWEGIDSAWKDFLQNTQP